MKPAEFKELVAKMRQAQKEYFNPKTRSLQVLEKARALEKEVDKQLSINEQTGEQASLF